MGCTVYVHITHCLLEFLAKAQFVWCHVKDGLGLANFLNIQGDFWELTFSFVFGNMNHLTPKYTHNLTEYGPFGKWY